MFLPGEFHGWRSLSGYSPWGHKDKESDTTERLSLHFKKHSKWHSRWAYYTQGGVLEGVVLLDLPGGALGEGLGLIVAKRMSKLWGAVALSTGQRSECHAAEEARL